MQSPSSVCLHVRLFPLYLSNRLTFGLAREWVTTKARRGLKMEVTGQGQDTVGLTSILNREVF